MTRSNEEFELHHVNTITNQEKSWELKLVSDESADNKKLIRRRFRVDEYMCIEKMIQRVRS